MIDIISVILNKGREATEYELEMILLGPGDHNKLRNLMSMQSVECDCGSADEAWHYWMFVDLFDVQMKIERGDIANVDELWGVLDDLLASYGFPSEYKDIWRFTPRVDAVNYSTLSRMVRQRVSELQGRFAGRV